MTAREVTDVHEIITNSSAVLFSLFQLTALFMFWLASRRHYLIKDAARRCIQTKKLWSTQCVRPASTEMADAQIYQLSSDDSGAFSS